MSFEPILYYDRYKRTIATEQVYGERWLRWTYGNPLGRLALHAVIKRALFAKFYGWRMNRPFSASKVLPFIIEYGLDHQEFAKSPFAFKNFNEFFIRALKPEARPIAPGDEVAVLPADGRHLVFPDLDAAGGFYVKGATFSAAELLGNAALAGMFAGGGLVISRLCPVDYHHFHFPCAGMPGTPRLINGCLYSVNPLALRKNLRYLIENKRVVTLHESPIFGTVALIEVGATCVGTIRQLFAPDRPVAKGEEKGLFKFGGSCVITLFQRGRIRFDEDLVAQSRECRETYARMGDRLGVAGVAPAGRNG
jgi:phosphatidylserine decarboxylase